MTDLSQPDMGARDEALGEKNHSLAHFGTLLGGQLNGDRLASQLA